MISTSISSAFIIPEIEAIINHLNNRPPPPPRVHELAKRAGAGRVKEGDEQVEHGPSGLDLAALAALSIN